MLEKLEILLIIFVLLLAFYLVIWLGAGKSKESTQSSEISRYLYGVKILLIILAIVGFILWFLVSYII